MNKDLANQSVNVFEHIILICREFRKQISKGEQPQFRKFLAQVSEEARSTLFSNLLEIELSFRRSRGDTPTSEEYVNKFHEYRSLILRAFFEPTLMSMEALSSAAADYVEETVTRTFESLEANRLGDYELIQELGRGGFGVVYEARHAKRNNRVALKTLPTGIDGQELNAERLHRFRKEFRTLAEINHPNLVGMQTLEVDGGQWFFTMDLIEGSDLLTYVRPNDQLDENRLRATLPQLVIGVRALHDCGIIHRDLKPSNVMVESSGRVLILDFGLAAGLQTPTDLTVSRSAMFAGTPRYAAPEQMFGQRSEASDWYALGVMLYESLTGAAPFRVKGPIELMRQKQHEEPASLAIRDDLPGDLTSLADSLLRRDPKERIDITSIWEALDIQSQGSSLHSSNSEVIGVDSTFEGKPILIGRDQQLAALEKSRTDILESQQPIVVFITGRSGEGKSSLASKFLGPLQRGDDFVVLTGRCYDRESVPYKVIDAVIDQLVSLLRSRDVSEISSLLPADIGFLVQLFPVLRRVPAIDIQSPGKILGIDERQIKFRAFAALRELFADISKRKPIIFFVDDLQWGDADSADVLRELVAPPNPPAILFLGGYRSDEADKSDFLRKWNEFNDENSGFRPRLIEVKPLTAEQCLTFLETRIVDAPFDVRQQARELYENTKGNPYFLEQLVQGYDAESKNFQPIPLNEIIDRKLQSLPENALSLLKIIAVSGKALPVSEVASLAGEDTTTYGTVTHMRSESLVRMIGSREEPSVDTYHDKIRETVLAELPDDERRGQHLKIGEFIEQQERFNATELLDADSANELDHQNSADLTISRLFDLAFHFYEASDRRAFIYQLFAGESSARSFAFETAIEHLTKANELLPENANEKLRFRVWECMARVYSRLNESDKAFDRYEAALAVAPDSFLRAKAYFGIALEHRKQGFVETSLDNFESALNEIGIRTPKNALGNALDIVTALLADFAWPSGWQRAKTTVNAKRALLASEICSAKSHSAMDTGVMQLVQTLLMAVRMALKSGDDRRLAFCYLQLGGNFAWAGMSKLSKMSLKRSAKFEVSTDDIELTALRGLYEGITNLANARFPRAIKAVEQGIELSLRCGDLYKAACNASILSHTLGIASPASQEMAIGLQHVQIGEASGDRRSICWGEFCYSHGLARHGLLAEAHRYMNRTLKLYEKELFAFTEPIGRSINAFVLLQSSQYELAQREAAMGWKITERKKVYLAQLVRNLPWLMESFAGANWLEARADFDSAYAHRLCKRANKFMGLSMIAPHMARSMGRVYANLGSSGKAIKWFQKAIDTARKQSVDYELSRALLDLAAIQATDREIHRRDAIELLKKMESVIPRAESWLLGDQYDESVVAPEFDLVAWERENGSVAQS